jgi:2-polyprenyl-3-methyl-5-hydroxy-6-metoxy-1,4-benzoquinol methylase
MSSYFSNQRYEVSQFLPSSMLGMKVLEIGCGDGSFIENITVDCEYWGVEPDNHSAKLASIKLSKVLNGKFEDVYDLIPDDYFDCLICSDVIEHMINENYFILMVQKKLKNNSVIVGSIPNVRHISNLLKLLLFRDWKYEDSGILDKTHLRFFTFKSINRFLEKNQYDIELIAGINKITFRSNSFRQIITSAGPPVSD